ncbi:MAG: DUF1295 domain-containing protein [Clostridiales bacterium]|nr:DUF1295 domain-containing protein [Clostridiales bacterium]
MEFKKSKKLSYCYLAAVYILALAVAVLCYNFMPTNIVLLKVLAADVCATSVVYLGSLIINNSSVYDPYWSVQPIVIVVGLAIENGLNSVLKVFALIVVILWGIRLTANWAYTFKNLTKEDWRYKMFREKTGDYYPFVDLFGIHLFPTFVVYACMMPVIYVFTKPASVNAGSIIFYVIAFGAVVLQTISDTELHSFKKRGERGIIKEGAWKYIRHPNYLGEIVFWWAIMFATFCAKPSTAYMFIGAIALTLMFVFFSAPVADLRQSRKKGFEEYKEKTDALIPIKLIANKFKAAAKDE